MNKTGDFIRQIGEILNREIGGDFIQQIRGDQQICDNWTKGESAKHYGECSKGGDLKTRSVVMIMIVIMTMMMMKVKMMG